jgi:RNA polymerase sigma-70 factor (ECF subfamily)
VRAARPPSPFPRILQLFWIGRWTEVKRDIFLNKQAGRGVCIYRGKRGVTGTCVSTLIARAEAHSPAVGFGERVAENQRRVLHIAYSVLGNSADAEDVAQEAFLRAYQKFDSLREAEKFRAWVNRIVFRLALNRKRGYRRRLARDTAWQSMETPTMVDGAREAEQQVMLDRLRREIERLPKKLRNVLQLSLVEEMDAADVGAVLGIPAGTVRSRVHTARKLLLEVMQ